MLWRIGGLPAAAALLLALAVFVAAGRAAPTFPELTGPVVDQASIIDEVTESRLDRELRALQQASGQQVVVATVPSLQGYDIRDYGNRLFRHWQLGDKDRNDGVLLLVAAEDRKMAIEVGYGLEGTLTDAISKIIIEYSITPRFRDGDFAGGIAEGVDKIMRVLKGEGEAVAAEAPRPARNRSRNPAHCAFPADDRADPHHPQRPGPRHRAVGRQRRGLVERRRLVRRRGLVGGGGYSGGGGSSGGGGASGSW